MVASNFWSKFIVAGLIGWGAGSWLELTGRQMIFPIVLMLALFVLWALARGQKSPQEQSEAGDELVSALLNKEQSLTDAEARQWLDDFLVRQQRKF